MVPGEPLTLQHLKAEGFRGLGFRVWGLEIRVQGLGFRVRV